MKITKDTVKNFVSSGVGLVTSSCAGIVVGEIIAAFLPKEVSKPMKVAMKIGSAALIGTASAAVEKNYAEQVESLFDTETVEPKKVLQEETVE